MNQAGVGIREAGLAIRSFPRKQDPSEFSDRLLAEALQKVNRREQRKRRSLQG